MKAVVIVSDDTIKSAGAETGISRDKWVNSEASNALPRYPVTWRIYLPALFQYREVISNINVSLNDINMTRSETSNMFP